MIGIKQLLIGLVVCVQAYAQTPRAADSSATAPTSVTVVRKPPTDWMKAQIKSVSDFVARYNRAVKPHTPSAIDTLTGATSPASALRALFNEDDPRLKASKKGMLSVYSRRVSLFIEETTQPAHPLPIPVRLLARVDVKVWLGNRTDTLRVYLQKRYTTDSAAYWQVVGADRLRLLPAAKKVGSPPADTVKKLFLPPNAHEVAFLPLLRGLKDDQSLLRFAADTLRPQPHEVAIEKALRSGQLLAESTMNTLVYVDTGRGWVLQLDEYVREKNNSGWLIADLFDTHTMSELPLPLRTILKPAKP
ncbi:hypothetical protein GCM10023187_51960 [Nibrella viscosa]|uniref:Uncharacterized protein n=1 Tax=Nibrella viscosa TaxID=1084524 RepID=A0ABP8KYB6_9BACT